MTKRQFGTATNSREAHLERVLAALEMTTPQLRYQQIAAGITNHNWLIFDGDRKLFVKLFGEGTEAYIDRTASHEASRIAGENGVGPEVIAYLPEFGAEVFAFLDGYRPICVEEMLSEGPRSSLIGCYRRMHDAGRISRTLSWFDQLADRVDLARSCDAPVPADLDYLLAQCDRARQAVEASGIDYRVCHNDSYAANFLVNDAGNVRVIDWEYAANNDYVWDLAMLSVSGCNRQVCDQLALEYAGEMRPALAARIQIYAPIVLISWGIWAAQQCRVSEIPFDYRSYSRTLIQLGRQQIGSCEWESALWQV